MKYKQLYLDAQVRFARKLKLLQSNFGDIHKRLDSLYWMIDKRNKELSPELHKEIRTALLDVDEICFNMTYNFEEYANQKLSEDEQSEQIED